MKTKFIIILIAFSVSNIFAQTDSLTFVKDIDNLNQKVSLLENKIETIRTANTKILQEHKSLKNSQFTLKKYNKELKGSFELYKQNTEIEIDSLQQVINSNTANIKKTANELGLKPLAYIKSYADAAHEPVWFTTAPAKALPIALTKANLSISDVDFFFTH